MVTVPLWFTSQKHQSPGFACSEIRYPLYLDALKSEHLRLVFKWLGLKKRETQNTHRCATSSKVKNSNFECYKLFIAIKSTFQTFIKVLSISQSIKKCQKCCVSTFKRLKISFSTAYKMMSRPSNIACMFSSKKPKPILLRGKP